MNKLTKKQEAMATELADLAHESAERFTTMLHNGANEIEVNKLKVDVDMAVEEIRRKYG